jgi:protein O-GlcNAc transferase
MEATKLQDAPSLSYCRPRNHLCQTLHLPMRKRTSVLVPHQRPDLAQAQRSQQDARAYFVEAARWVGEENLAKAEVALDQHLRLAPQSWPGLSMKALLAEQTHRYALVESILPGLLHAKPDYAQGHSQWGRVCVATGRLDAACGHFQRALQYDPTLRSAQLGWAAACRQLGRTAEALALLHAVLEAEPQSVDAHFQMGEWHRAQGDIQAAMLAYKQVLALDPQHGPAASSWLFCQHYVPSIGPAQRLESAQLLGPLFSGADQFFPNFKNTWDPERTLRVGVMSGDLRRHPVGHLLEPVLAQLQHHDWQWTAFANSADSDALTQRLRPHFAAWHDVHTWTDAVLLNAIREARVDILIDLSGHTAGHRLAVFGARAAPLQVSWLGYFGSTGLPEMDALLADPHSVPADESAFYSEEVLCLPKSRWCFAPPLNAPPVSPLPVLAGQSFTFGCFQELGKINDEVLQAWQHIVSTVPQSRLRLQSVRLGYTDVMEATSNRMRKAGFEPHQFQLCAPQSHDEYLASYAGVDLVLDTFPYPGGMTTVEALWMGVPTLTLAWPGMLGRQGASLMTAAGLGDWVCHSLNEYKQRAVALAQSGPVQRQHLSDLRAGLRAHLEGSALMDASAFTADLYSTLRQFWRRHCGRQLVNTAVL